jgi:DNA-binding NarL/FixJ family response regulator
MGYSTDVLSKLLGINPTTVRRIRGGSQDSVYLRHHQQIKALYAELLSRGRRGASQRAVVDAVAHGWVSAGSWNDADLDDPGARPIEKTSRVCTMTPPRRIDVAELLRRIREGETVDGIARHFGVKRATVKRRITRLRTAGVLPPYDPTIQTRSAA